MSPQRRHLLEKLQVQVAAAAALAVAYFLLAPAIRPWELDGAMTFLPMGDLGRLAVFAVLVWALAAGCAILTVSARPEGALLAALVGAAGFSFRSGSMQTLLWRWEENLSGLYAVLSAEALAMTAVALGAVVVIRLVRAVARRLCPRWVWSAPQPVAKSVEGRGGKKDKEAADDPAETRPALHVGGAVLMEVAVAVLLLVVTFRSTDRGQIAFALAISFFLAALVAHQTFPLRVSAPLWFGPILTAALVFALGWLGLGGGKGPAWHAAQMVAQGLPLRAAMPIDWLTLGAGGAVAGIWLSSRIHEVRARSQETSSMK